jgi:hypothetical protein
MYIEDGSARPTQTSTFIFKCIIILLSDVGELLPDCSWLRHYATRRKVAGSSPDEVDFFNFRNASSRTVALGSAQPLTEMSTRTLPVG